MSYFIHFLLYNKNILMMMITALTTTIKWLNTHWQKSQPNFLSNSKTFTRGKRDKWRMEFKCAHKGSNIQPYKKHSLTLAIIPWVLLASKSNLGTCYIPSTCTTHPYSWLHWPLVFSFELWHYKKFARSCTFQQHLESKIELFVANK